MRILMLVLHPNIRSPVVKHTPPLIDALRSLGCDVVTEPWGRHRDQESVFEKIAGRIQDIIRIRRTLHHQHFDVMIVKTSHDRATLMRDIPLLLSTRRLCPHFVLQFHGSAPDWLVRSGSWLFKKATKLLLNFCDAAFVLSSEEQQQWKQFIPTGNFFITKNPSIPLDNQLPVLENLKWATPNDKPIVLFVGRLIKEKGIYDLINAMPLIIMRIHCHLLVVGEGEEAPRILNLVKKLGLENYVTITGHLKGAYLTKAYKTADIFVLPTYWFEGLPTVILEAIGAGLPIVTTHIRGSADYLEEGVNAIFVPPHDPQALADAVTHLLSDPILREKMSQANLTKVKEFSPEIVGDQFLDLIGRVIASKSMG